MLPRSRVVALPLAACGLLHSLAASASLFSGDALDTVADWMAIVVLRVNLYLALGGGFDARSAPVDSGSTPDKQQSLVR